MIDNGFCNFRNGIKKYNEKNKDQISRGYHETVTMFYISVVTEAIKHSNGQNWTFEEFLNKNMHLLDRNLLFTYYSDERINKSEAKSE